MNRKLLAVVVSGALAVPMAAQAVDFSVSGHIARAIVVTNDDGDTEVSHEDAGASGSRFRMTGSSDLDAGITAGVQLEYGVGDGGGAPTNRHTNLYFSGDFGKVTMGHQAPATNGTNYLSFSENAALGGVEIGCDYCDADFVKTYTTSRASGVRYDTPGFGPASVAVWSDTDKDWDTRLYASGDAGVGGYQFNIGYSDVGGTEAITIGGAVKLENGGHADVAWGKTNEDDSDYVNVGAGYNAGSSSVAVNWYTSDVSGGGSALSFGVGHNLGGGVQVFASYMHLDFEDDVNNQRDRDGDEMKEDLEMDNEGLFVVGARVQFN